MLRGPYHVKEVAHMLETTPGTHSVWFNERLLTSPEQAIAECLLIMERRLAGERDSARANAHEIPTTVHTSRTLSCPECNCPLEHASAATSVATVDIPSANKAATKMRSLNPHPNSEYLSFET